MPVRIRHLSLAVLATALLLVFQSPMLRAAAPEKLVRALDMAPAARPILVVVPDPQKFSDDISALIAAVDAPGLDLQAQWNAKRQAENVEAWMNFQAPFVLTMSWGDDPSEQKPTALIPVKDYATFARFAGVDAEGIGKKQEGENTNYYRDLGNGYALVTTNKAEAENYEQGKNSQAWLKVLDQNAEADLTDDALFVADLTQGRAQLEAGLAEMQRNMERDTPPALLPLNRFLVSAIRQASTDATSVIVGLDVSAQGAAWSFGLNFKPGSPTAKWFDGGGEHTNLLNRLPRKPFLMAFSENLSGLDLSGILGEIQKRLGQAQPEAAKIDGLLKELRAMLGIANKAAGVLYIPDPMAMAAGLPVVEIVPTEDPEALRQAARNYIQALNGFSVDAAPAADGANAGKVSITADYTENALQIDGVKVDSFRLQQQLPPNVQQQMGPMGMMAASPTQGFIATTADHLVVTTVNDAALLREAIQAAGKQDGLGTLGEFNAIPEGFTARSDLAVGYISTAGVAQLASNLAGMFMPNVAIDVPADPMPIVAGVGSSGDALHGQFMLPADFVKVITGTYSKYMQQMQQMQQQAPQRRGGPPPMN